MKKSPTFRTPPKQILTPVEQLPPKIEEEHIPEPIVNPQYLRYLDTEKANDSNRKKNFVQKEFKNPVILPEDESQSNRFASLMNRLHIRVEPSIYY